jgi:methyl-accepting chemotaxis protein
MDQVTQQNAAMVEETSAAARSLAHEAEGLADLVSRFSVKDVNVVDLGSHGPARIAAHNSYHPFDVARAQANG